MRAEILDSPGGNVVNVIIADQAFLDANYPGRWRQVAETMILSHTLRSGIVARITRNEFHKWRRVCVQAEATDTPSNDQMNALLGFEHIFRAETVVPTSESRIVALATSLVALGVLANAARANALFAAEA